MNVLCDQIKQEVIKLETQIVDFARRLIQLPSESGKEQAVANVIKEEMIKLGFDEVLQDIVGNVIGIIKGDGTGDNIMFNCHMDQVPPGNLKDWEYHPFDGTVADGYVHGRGASDVKGAIATQVYSAYLLKTMGIKLKGDVILTFVIDEEPGDMWGMKRLCKDWLDRPIALVVLGEATSLDIYLGHRGRLEMQLISNGRMSHSSAPWLGINAINKMVPVLAEIEKLGIDLPENNFLGKSTISITHISCEPGWGSTVPDVCYVNIDRRFIPSETTTAVIAQVEEVIKRNKMQDHEINIQVKTRELFHTSYTGIQETELLDKPAYLTSKDNSYVQKAAKALNEIGQNPEYGKWNFGTDGAYTAHVLGIPTIGYSCGEEIYAHRSTDRVNIELMLKATAGNIVIALSIAG
ncbi:MAG: YgeY family selenium metabolism-linked hydrolase [Clostridia bacterium]